MAAMLIKRFNSMYEKRPVLTTMITNAILGGIADTFAQTLTAYKQRSSSQHSSIILSSSNNSSSWAKDIKSQSSSSSAPRRDRKSSIAINSSSIPLEQKFDFRRLTRFMAYGFIMAPLQHKWFSFLSRIFPLPSASLANKLKLTTPTSPLAAAFKRVVLDQCIFAPVGLAAFFTYMTYAEGGTWREVRKRLRNKYWETLKANFLVWPAAQMLNFRVIPLQFQIPFVSTVGIAWTAFLSLTNSSNE